MVTIKFIANGAELEADLVVKHFQNEQYLIYLEDLRCGGESLDQEEQEHLFTTNPTLPHDLGLLAIARQSGMALH